MRACVPGMWRAGTRCVAIRYVVARRFGSAVASVPLVNSSFGVQTLAVSRGKSAHACTVASAAGRNARTYTGTGTARTGVDTYVH